MSVFAADVPDSISTSNVEDDLGYYFEDLNTYFLKKLTDSNIYLVHFIESGFDEINGVNSSGFGLFVYLYNPSGKLPSYELSKIQFATAWSKGSNGDLNGSDYKTYELSFVNANADHTLLKYKVFRPDEKLVFYNESNGTRRYDISGIELANNVFDIKDYTVGYTYIFEGFAKGLSAESLVKSTLSCKREDLLTIKVDAHQVSYLTGNSSLGTGYSNQVNSVYFSIPKEIEKEYGNLQVIKYEYYHYYTSPIIVTDNETSYDILYSDRGRFVNHDSWEYEISTWVSTGVPPVVSYDYVFHYGKRVNGGVLNPRWYETGGDEPNIFPRYLTTIFLDSDGWETGDVLFGASELEAYFQEYKSSYHTGKRFGYSSDLFDLEKSKGYQVMTKDVNATFSLKGYNDSHNRWEYFSDFGFRPNRDDFDNVENIRYITPIASSAVFNDKNFEKNYLVDDLYKDDFRSFYNKASVKGENVYLLRYAFANDYYSLDLTSDGLNGDFIMCQGNVYLNFDFIYFGFGNSEELTIIPVVSDPTSGFFDGIDTTPEKDTFCDFLKNLLNKLEKFGKIFGIILLVLVVIALVLIVCMLIKPLNELLTSIFKKENKKKTRPPKTITAKKRYRKRRR